MTDPHPIILLVDSDDAIRRLFGRQLSHSFTVLACATDEDALEHIRQQPVAALIIGLRPPFNKSLELIELFKHYLEPRTAPIIAYSPVNQQDLDGDIPTPYFINQPVKPAQLVDFLHQVLREQASIR